MGFKERVVKYLASEMIEREVGEAVARAKAALPITANYDPKGEGYRRLTATGEADRDLHALSQDRMFEIAYFMWDNSLMMRRLAVMDKSFIFSGPVNKPFSSLLACTVVEAAHIVYVAALRDLKIALLFPHGISAARVRILFAQVARCPMPPRGTRASGINRDSWAFPPGAL